MKLKLKKAAVLLGIACLLNTMIAGCGSGSDGKTEDSQGNEVLQEERGDTPSDNSDGEQEAPQANTGGKWKVFEPELAEAVDADFIGKVWKMEEDSFLIAEKQVALLEDGPITRSSPSSNADIPDSQLIRVVFDDNTYFYMRTVQGDGENHEDKEAGFQDLKEYMSVEMKGRFENDVFYADEIRMM